MYVVVNVLARDDRGGRVTLLGGADITSVLELQTFLLEASLDGAGIAVLVLAVLNGCHVVRMLLGENFSVLYRLNGSVIMVLVDLTVDGRGGLLMTVLGNVLIHDGGGDLLVDRGVMVTSLVPVGKSQPTESNTTQALTSRVAERTN